MLLALHEVGRNPFAQALGLADIDDRAGLVHELIDPGRERQHRDLFLERRFIGVIGHMDVKSRRFRRNDGASPLRPQ